MSTTFNEVAQSIISESIKSAVFIDDKIPSLFSDEDDTEEVCKPLYDSFRENHCSLDFFKFNESWKDSTKLLFDRKDLLILDWELNNTEPLYLSSLGIVDKAVETDNLHFVCIYSLTKNVIADIFYKILAYYSGNNSEVLSIKKELTSIIEDDWGMDSETLFNDIKSMIKELTLGSIDDIKQWNINFQKKFGSNYSEFRKFLTEKLPKNKQYCEISKFGFIINDELNYRDEYKENIYIKCNVGKNYLQINNTYFSVFKKGATQADNLYNQFCNAIIDANENFLTLLSLEIKNKVLNRSAFIGKELSNIKEKAFFHHMENVEPETAFKEYLIELWKNYHTGFLYVEEPTLFNVLDDYKTNRKDSKTVPNDDLAKLNYFYNICHNTKENRNIGFGDCFKIEKENSNEYLLCITPHCDCLHPKEKIKGFYFFVKGNKIDTKEGLSISDTGYVSFLKEDENIICIKWDNKFTEIKPFTLHLCEKQRKISQTQAIIYGNDVCDFSFIGTIKENYAQRIANKAFSYPMRVGISFVKNEK
jgi:hypothetical protein